MTWGWDLDHQSYSSDGSGCLGVTFSDDDWDVQSLPKRIVFRFHYHSQKVSQDPLGYGFYLQYLHLPIFTSKLPFNVCEYTLH